MISTVTAFGAAAARVRDLAAAHNELRAARSRQAAHDLAQQLVDAAKGAQLEEFIDVLRKKLT